MSDLATTSWSETDANNNTNPPFGWPANMLPNKVEPTARMMMGAIKRSWNRENPVYLTTQSTADSYVITPSDASPGYNLYEVISARFNIANASTSPTLLFSGLPPQPIRKMSASSVTVLVAGDIRAKDHSAYWDGSRFILQDPVLPESAAGTTGTGAVVLQTAPAVGGAWTALSTWTLPAITLGGTVTVNGQTISGAVVFNNGLSGITTLAGTGAVTGFTSGTFSAAVSANNIVVTGNTVPANGLYLEGSNRVSLTTNTTRALSVDSAGNVYAGGSADASSAVKVDFGAHAQYWEFDGGASGDGNVYLTARGAAAAVSVNISAKSTGQIILAGALVLTGQTVNSDAAAVSTNSVSISVNGTVYKFLVKT